MSPKEMVDSITAKVTNKFRTHEADFAAGVAVKEVVGFVAMHVVEALSANFEAFVEARSKKERSKKATDEGNETHPFFDQRNDPNVTLKV